MCSQSFERVIGICGHTLETKKTFRACSIGPSADGNCEFATYTNLGDSFRGKPCRECVDGGVWVKRDGDGEWTRAREVN